MDKHLPYLSRTFCLTIPIFVLLGQCLQAQDHDNILGKWLNDEKGLIIEVFKEGSQYCGKIAWFKPSIDLASAKNQLTNPPEKQVQDLKILSNFLYSTANQTYESGTLYDYQSGHTYSCQMWLESKKTATLHIRSYIGLPILGSTSVWVRPDDKHPVYGRNAFGGK